MTHVSKNPLVPILSIAPDTTYYPTEVSLGGGRIDSQKVGLIAIQQPEVPTDNMTFIIPGRNTSVSVLAK